MKCFILLSSIVILAAAFRKGSNGNFNITLWQHRIINGTDATEGQFPYQVALILTENSGNIYLCGGSLINSEWVLTAAHCLTNITSAIVGLGSIYIDNPAVSFLVDRKDLIPHEDYVELEPYPNDIGLIKIPKVEFTQNIQKLDLPKKSSSYPDFVGENVNITGWGQTTDDPGSISNILQYAIMNVISNKECNDIIGDISSKQICARDLNSRTCGGDSGGPLVLEEPKVLIGVVSFGEEVCTEDSPDVFTRVTSYLDWIAENTGIEI